MSASPGPGEVDPGGIDLVALAVLPMFDDDDDGGGAGGGVAGLVPLARTLVALDSPEGLAGLSAGDLVDAARVFARLEAYAAGGLRRVAAQLERCSELTERVVTVSAQRRDAEAGRDVTGPPATRTFRVTQTASDELMMCLGISRREANRLVAEGRAYGGDLSVVGEAVAEGYLSAPKASRLFEALVEEPLEVALSVCEDLVPIAPALPAAEVERRARRLVIAADPARAVERHERARGYRNVSPVRLLPDGMARIVVTSSVADVTTVHTVCDRAARAAKAGGDQRTLDQLRADTLVTLASGAITVGSALSGTTTAVAGPTPAATPAPTPAASETTAPGTRAEPGEASDDEPPWSVHPVPEAVSDGAGGGEASGSGVEVRHPGAGSATQDGPGADRDERGPLLSSVVTDRFDARGAHTLLVRRGLLEQPADDIDNTAPDPAGTAEDAGNGVDGGDDVESARAGRWAEDAESSLDHDAPAAGPETGALTGPGTSSGSSCGPGGSGWLPRGLAQDWADFLTPATDPAVPRAPEPPPVPRPEDREPVRLGWLAPEIAGIGPLDHATVRRLAQHPPPWLRVVLLDTPVPEAGAQLPAESGYHPSAALHRAVARAHPTCVAPGCFVPAGACQDDHVVPYPQGTTSLENLRPLCLRHHVLKTHRGHHYTADARGVVWTTATGHRYLTTPAGATIRLGRTDLNLPGP